MILRSAATSLAVCVGLLHGGGAAAAAPTSAPVVRDAELTMAEDTSVDGQVALVARPNETLSVKLKRPPQHGELVLLDASSGAFTFRPAKDFNGDDAFAVEVSNGRRTSVAKVALHISPVNDAPATKPLTLSPAEDSAARGTVVATDVDRDVLTYRLSVPPEHGDAMVDPRSGGLTYRPNADYHGSDTLRVEVSDGSATADAEVSIAVSAVNDAPVAKAGTARCIEDVPCDGVVAATDVDGDALTYRLVVRPKRAEVTVDAASGAFHFVPAKDVHGPDAFSVEVSDGKLKATAVCSVDVAAQNDAPVPMALSLSTSEDTAAQGTAHATDIDGDELRWSVAVPPQHGTARIDARSGAVWYQPAADSFGSDTFKVSVSDGTASADAEVSVAVSAVNDAPVVQATAYSVDEDGTARESCPATDVDGDALSFKVGQKPKHGALELDAKTGAFVYQPAHDYAGHDNFTVQVSDGRLTTEAVMRLTVRPVNDAPVPAPLELKGLEDEVLYGAMSATDVDADVLRYELAAAPAHGEAKVDPRTGAVSYTPSADYQGPDTFAVSVSDGTTSSSTNVTVALSAVDDAPRVTRAILAMSEDQPGTGALPGRDVDGDALAFRIVTPPKHAKVEIVDAALGKYRVAPDADVNGDDELTFEVSDGKTAVQGAVALRIAPVNDAPTLAGAALETREDEPVAGAVSGRDIDADTLSYAVAAQPAKGRASVDPRTGAVRFEPAKDAYGDFTFTVVTTDGQLTSAPATVSVRVSPVNDAPVAKANTVKCDEDTKAVSKLEAFDVDGDAVTFAVIRAPAHGTLQLTDVRTGAFVYTPSPNFFGDDSFAFEATDPSGAVGRAEMALMVRAVNDPPVAVADNISGPCHGSVSGRLQGFDRESRRVTFHLVEEPRYGRVKLDSQTGDFTFYTDGGDEQQVSFKFAAFDGEIASPPAELTVHLQSACGNNG